MGDPPATASFERPKEAAQVDSQPILSDHLVQFYENEQQLSEAVAHFLAVGLKGNDHLLVIATADHHAALRQQLEALGFEVARFLEEGRITLLDAHETLARLLRDGQPDAGSFEAELGRFVARKTQSLPGSARLRVYGEMIDLLWKRDQHEAAIRLEELWSDLQQRHGFTLLYAYQASTHREKVEQALRASVRELRRKEQALRESQQQLELITDTLPTLVSYVDAERRYRFVSAAYERWFGHPKSEVIGKHLEQVLGPAAYAAVKPHLERTYAGETVSYEAQLPYRDGGSRWVEAMYIPQRASSGQVAGYIGLVADVTERKKLEEFRTVAVERAGRLLKITSAIADAVSDSQVFEAVVDHVASALEASSVGLWLVDERRTSATLVRSVGYADAARSALASLSLEGGTATPVLDSIQSRQPVWIASQAELLERYPHLRGVATPGRAYRVACLPIVVQGELLGALGVTFEAGHGARHDEREFLLLIAGYASQALQRLRLLEQERRSRAAADAAAVRMGILSHASRAFVETSLDLEARLNGIASTFGTLISSSVGISLVGPDGRLDTSATYHPDPEAQALLEALSRAHRLGMGDSISGATIAAGKSTWLPAITQADLMARAAPPYRAFLARFPISAIVCVPLRAGGRIIGVVLTARVRKGETYTREDLELIEQLAERSAAAIDNSRLYEEALQARTRSDQLSRFAQSVMNAANVEQVLDAALDAIEAALGTRRAAVLTYGGEEKMRFRRWRNLSDEYRAAVEGHSPWAADAVSLEPVLVADALADPSLAAYGPLFGREGIGALAFFPLVTGGRLIGKFMVYFERPHHLSQHELELIQAISNHLASVITRFEAVARLEETVRANELFAGVLAHDLRNPLGAMLNAAQLIELRRAGQGGDDRESKPLRRILSSGQRMRTMIEQLLDFTRARSGGGVEVDPQDTNLADLCAEAVSEFELSHPGAKVRCEVAGDQRGSWDADRLLQVFSNLLSNAGQHGAPDKGISLKLDGTAPDQLEVDIHNGGAIPSALMPRLFDPFRSTAHGRERARGLGLGLFIIREIVRAHGGTVEVSSSEEAGTTFSIRLPRHAARRSTKSAAPALREGS